MDVKRIDSYTDGRFSRTVLLQHGAYLVDGEPYEIEITGQRKAVVRGKSPAVFGELIESFRFHAPQITRFFGEDGGLAADFPQVQLVNIELDRIQPSQFFVDEEKLSAVRSFIRTAEDIVIQVLPWENGFISLDGHTRLYLAVQNGYRKVKAVVSESEAWVWKFVHEARRRGITRPGDMRLLPHNEYVLLWDRYCDEVFANGE